MKNLYFSSSIRGMKEKSTRKNTVLLRSIRRKTMREVTETARLHGIEIQWESLTIRSDERDNTFEVIKVCQNCGQNVTLHSTDGRSVFRLGLNVDLDRIRNVTKCPYCRKLVEFTAKEAKVLDLPIREFHRWFDKMPKTPKWDGTWSKAGLLRDEE